MEVSNKPKLHPVMWVAAVSVIVLSLAGVGAITGMIPTVGSKPADPLVAQTPAPLAATPAPAAEATPAPQAAALPPAEPAPAKHTEHKHAQVAANTAATTVHEVPAANAAPVAPPVCHECGTVEAIKTVEVKGEGTGVGAVGGAVVGGLLGSTMGRGHGKDAMTVLGAVGGGLAGHQIEKNVRKKTRFDIVVQFDDGTTRTFSQEQAPAWRSGDRVRLLNGQLAALN